MRTVSALKSPGEPYTWEDLEDMPDDGRRYEIVDGTLIVTPSPILRHQRASLRLSVLLDAHFPTGLEVITARYDVKLADDTVFEPDLLVTPVADGSTPRLEGPPLLAVEILSPSTRLIDLNVTKDKFEAAGRPSFWVVDPDAPSVTVWELRDGAYEQVAHALGVAECKVDRPFPVTVVPERLIAVRR